jgi:hypothetical protein
MFSNLYADVVLLNPKTKAVANQVALEESLKKVLKRIADRLKLRM